MRRRFGLRAQFILLIIFGLFVLFASFAVVAIRQQSNNLQKSLKEGSRSFAALATKPIGDSFVLYQDSGRLKIEQQIEKFTQLDSNISNVSIVDVSGSVLYQQNDSPISVSAAQASSFDTAFVDIGDGKTQVITPFIEDFGAHRYSIVYDISDQAIRLATQQLTRQITLLAMLGLFVTIGISYFLINKLFLRPLSDVSEAATSISRGNYDVKIRPEHNDEIGDVAVSVNAMADALKADIRKLEEVDAVKSEFMTIASHNLRTPLTVMKGYLETLEALQELPESAQRMIRTISGSTNRLSVFAEDMLIIARLESGQEYTSTNEDCNLTEIIQGICDDAEPLAHEKQLKFTKELPQTACVIKGSSPHIRAALWNVLDNALKFTKQGYVAIRLVTDDKNAIVTIQDTGVGIKLDEQPKLFTKFHRGTDIMEYNFEGTGIGLYLTKLIIEKHEGNIVITSSVGEGTTAKIELPLIK